jgi:hypothetical protein
MSTPAGAIKPQVSVASVTQVSDELPKLESRSDRSVKSTTLSELMSPDFSATVDVLTVAAVEALPAASTAVAVYVYEVEGVSPLSVYVKELVVAMSVPPLRIW